MVAPSRDRAGSSTRPNQRTSSSAPSSPAVARAFIGRIYIIPHAQTRFTHQLRYIERISLPHLRNHTSAVLKIFLDLLHLQLRFPPSIRFQLLMGYQDETATSESLSAIDIFSMYSPTVSMESEQRRTTVSSLAEILVQFKLLCKEGVKTSLAVDSSTAAASQRDIGGQHDEPNTSGAESQKPVADPSLPRHQSG